MDNYTLSQLKMLKTSDKTMDKYHDNWKDVQCMVDYKASLLGSITAADHNLDLLEAIKTGPAQTKSELEILMEDAAMRIRGSAWNYADDNSLTTLKDKMHITRSDFTLKGEIEKANLAQMIFNEVDSLVSGQTNKLADYKVVPADMLDLQTKITDYKNSVADPKLNINEGSDLRAEVKNQVRIGIKWAEKIDNMMDQFKDDAKEFHDMFIKARNIIPTGHRSKNPICTISGKTIDFDTEAAIEGTKVWIMGEEKDMVMSDANGDFSLEVYVAGEQLLVGEKMPGYKRWEDTVTIGKGEDQEMNLDLEPENPTPPVEPPPTT